MAKKKQIELTIEEKLKNTLVPKEEQPYKIPNNWCWVRLDFLLKEICNGTTIKQNKEGKTARVTRIESLQNNTIDFNRIGNIVNESLIKDKDWYIEGDIIVSHINSIEHVGKSAVITRDMLPLVHGMNLLRLRLNNICNSQFFQLYTRTTDYKKSIVNRVNRAVNQVSINQKQLCSLEIPITNLKEQQRIVNRIESLFAKIDRAKELIENTLAQFEQNKMAILHKAFTGELTEKWRKENNIDLSSWQEKTIDELCTSLKYGTSKKSNPEGSVVVLRMGNLQNGEIDWSNLMYTDDKDDIEKYLLKKGDVLFNRTNSPELVGKTSIYRGEYPAIYAGYLIKLDYGKDIIGEYLNYIMNSTKAKHYCYTVKTDGVSQSNINAKKIGAFEIPVPTIEEQQEIVNILDKIFIKYDKIKDLQAQIDKIEFLKKSILAKAFRGELGTNDPNEESAELLLREILAEK